MKNLSFRARLGFAFQGVLRAARTERSFATQLAAAVLVFIVLIATRPEPVWWAILLGACGSVISLELLNTALEALADHLHPERHPSIKQVKDCAAGAVLVASLTAVALFLSFLFSRV